MTLQTEFILEESDLVEMNNHLQSLPRNPTAAYQNVLHRLPPKTAAFARRILGWIFYALRVPTMNELREALAVRVGDLAFDHSLLPAADSVVRTCGGLIVYDQDNGLVTFSHETVRPFLKENELGNLPSHSDICKTCLTYLHPAFEKPVMEEEFDDSDAALDFYYEQKRKFKFCNYTVTF